MTKREEIENKYKWDLSSYYKNNEEWEDEYSKTLNEIELIKQFENSLTTSDNIYNCFEFDHNISIKIQELYVFAQLKVCEDFSNSTYIGLKEKAKTLSNKYSVFASFIMPELSKLSSEFLTSLKQEERFTNYSLVLDEIIRQKPHTLSEKEERLMANVHSFAGGFSNVFDAFDSEVKFEDAINSDGEKLPLTHALYGEYMMSSDSALRKSAFLNMHKKFGEYNSTLAMNYINNIKAELFYSKARNFNSSLEASIFNEQSSESVYKALIKAVNSKLNVFHKYYLVKAKLLNLEKICICDRLAPVAVNVDKKYTYEEAIELIVNAMAPMGEEYQNLIRRAKNERWIDVFENEGKESGAFCGGAYKKTVVLTNFTGNLNSVFTLAHELGHAMHSYFSEQTQCFEKSDYSVFVAEIASTVHEMLLLRYLLNLVASNEEKLYLLDYFCSMMCSTVHRQTMFAEFEEFAHKTYQETGALSQDILNDKYLQLNKAYFGSNVEVLDEVKYEWSRISHFYNSFYVYKYATGLIAAILISEKLVSGLEDEREHYFEFLKAGGSLAPIETVKLAGIDLENSQTMEDAFKFFKDMINELENLIN